MVLVGYRFKQCANTRGIVIKPEIRCGEHRHDLAATLIKVGEDADEVPRFLRIGRDQHLFFK